MGSGELNSPSVLGRAFHVLDAFSDDATGITLTELAHRTGMPKGSLHRMLSQLVEFGVLERVGDAYFLGLHLFELAKQVPIQSRLREAALPYMMDLYEEAHETIHLGVLDDLDVIYVERLGGHRQVRCDTRVGGRMPAYCTGLGKAILAFSSADLLHRVVARGLNPLTPYTIRAPGLLVRDLLRARTLGFAVDHEESVVGVTCVAAPIILNGRPIAAVSVTGPSTRTNVSRFGRAVTAAVGGIARSMQERDSISPLTVRPNRRDAGSDAGSGGARRRSSAGHPAGERAAGRLLLPAF
jgi:DNA-binding IclR family transcriptional regulator